jgi:hypothetical protein
MSSLQSIRFILAGALIIGIGCAAFFYFTFRSRLIPPQVRFFDIWIPLVVVVFMTILIRSTKTERTFHFWESLIAGNLMCWIGGLFSGLLLWQLSNIEPTAFQNFLQSSIKYLIESEKNGPENMKMKNLPLVLDEIRQTQSSFLIWDELKIKIGYSLVLVPLVSLILRRK